jgi:hypothetical protein
MRLWMLLAAMVAAATLVAADVAPPTETKSDAPAKAPEKPAVVERIVAVGDVHGDFDQLVKVLRAAEVINDKNQWIGGKTHLVQTGDVFDRGPDSRKAMDLLMSLEAEAAKAGGAVHALVGNHEAMVLADHWQYLTEEELKSFGGEEEFRKAVGPEGKYGKWIRSHDAVLKLSGILFLHAGLRGAYAKMSLEEINKSVREELAKNEMEDVTADPSGPLWDRRFSLDEGDEVSGQLAEVLKQQGASHMIVGHTVMREGITPRLGGRVICIDVGMSKAYGGPASCLLIEKGVFYVVEAGKEKRKLDVPAAAVAPVTAPVKDSPVTPSATPAVKVDPKLKVQPAPEVEPSPQTPVPLPTR